MLAKFAKAKPDRVSIGLSISLGIVLTLLAGLNSGAIAQSNSGDGNYQSNEKDETYGDAPAGLNPMDLMHRAQQLNGRSAAEFDADSQGQIDNSASDYKLLQQQRILERQKPAAKPSVEKGSEASGSNTSS